MYFTQVSCSAPHVSPFGLNVVLGAPYKYNKVNLWPATSALPHVSWADYPDHSSLPLCARRMAWERCLRCCAMSLGLHTVLHTMQSLLPAVFLMSHMVFIKLLEVEELHDGAVEELVVICLPLKYRNEQNGGNEHSFKCLPFP